MKLAPDSRQSALSLRSITLNYSDLRVLTNIDIDIKGGEIHAIIGEHGAGKSSLAAIMSGLQKPQSGQISIAGKQLSHYNLRSARAAKIHMVYQQSYLNENFSVAENLFYTTPLSTRVGIYSRTRIQEYARAYLDQFGISIDPRIELRLLSLSERTVIEILKNLHEEPQVLILDEALEKLSLESFEKIIPLLENMRKQNRSVVTITHRIDDMFHLADTVTVLKAGNRLLTDKVDNISKLNLIRMAYTQVGETSTNVDLDAEFYQFLKYNEAILQHLPVNIVVVDENLIIKMVNEHCIENLVLEDQAYLNTSLKDFLSGDDHALMLIKQSVTNREPKTFYNVTLTIRKTRRINNIKTYPVFDGYNVIGTIIIIEDITEYDQLQKRLILSEKLASVGLLAAGVAHEINNPLEIISNYLSYIQYSHQEPDIQESMKKVHREIEYISKIVGNLVTFSSNRQTGLEIVDINDILTEIFDLLQYNAKEKNIQLHFSPSPVSPKCHCEKDQIKQVILNLVKNSFEAMPDGGEIRIQTNIGSFNGNPCSCIVFEDSGPGIHADDITTVFLPFFSSKPDGTHQLGLGLSISYRIVESFGGEMRVENLPEKGCRFTISLPASNTDV